MGGRGGGDAFEYRTPTDLQAMVRRAEERTTVAAFEAQLAGTLSGLLGNYNGRDVVTVRERLDELKNALENSIEGTVDQLYGGSVAKHTYVDGLSDIDSLIIFDEDELRNGTPQEALRRMEQIISRKVGGAANVSAGRMAITIEYEDGMVIQLLPAMRTKDDNLHVPSSRRDGWSRINPIKFQEALSRRNRECSGKLVPTVKLAKAIVGQLPDAQKLSGYHMESLAIAAFRNYDGEKTTAAMLPAFFEKAKDLVLTPIRDSTGQSIHVDEYLGPAGSSLRQSASHLLGRLARRMRNATAAGSTEQWKSLFGLQS